MQPENKKEAWFIHIEGLVQGVGFRPFVFLQAEKYAVKGWVENSNDGVNIHAEGLPDDLSRFISTLKKEAPLASKIYNIEKKSIQLHGYSIFEIRKSRDLSDEITEISPDIAVCPACLKDMRNQEHRLYYPFVNCTHCGPRFTIISDLPYDREKTSMRDFPMCSTCKEEYENVYDRRFHAQPVACNHCGPEYSLIFDNGSQIAVIHEIISHSCEILEKGGIIAFKGLGGYNLACDALNEAAVSRLRKSKLREGKPFAVMFGNIENLWEYVEVNAAEVTLLTSWQRPIVLLKKRKDLAPSVSNGLNTIGVMLPYLPVHHLLFEKLKLQALVMTSGNLSDEPITIRNDEALQKLGKVTDAVLLNNREIVNRTDDSVAMVVHSQTRLIRRSRGYVPSPLRLSIRTEGIFASGAELNACFCIGKGNQAILSQHIGDLKNIETLGFYREAFFRFKKMFRFEPTLAVCDLHPDYLSSVFAEEMGIPLIKVQHHHAHIVSAMAENNIHEPVIGISLDGLGLGEDGHLWGGEILLCETDTFTRLNHFEYIPMPGGDKASMEPWRMALSYLFHVYGKEMPDLDFLKQIPREKPDTVLQMLQNKFNSPLTSSCGRLFDAVAAIINLNTVATWHAEAPMRLESIIEEEVSEKYNFEIKQSISFKETIRGIVNDKMNGIDNRIISARFHNTVISAIFEAASSAGKQSGINKIVLSGGSFQNRYLLEKSENLLTKNGFKVFSSCMIPANDGGIALGQLIIAASKREKKCV